MLNRIEGRIDNITYNLARKLNLQGKKMREFMKPGEVIIANAKKWRSEIEEDTFQAFKNQSPPMFVVHTAKEQVEDYRDRYDDIRILDQAYNVYGKPLPPFWGTIVGVPKPAPAQPE